MTQEPAENKNLTYWWFPLLFGVLFILIGIWILRSPVESFEKITRVIGVIILVSGTTQVWVTLGNRHEIPGWGFQLAGAFMDLAIGIILVIYPEFLLRIITFFVGAWLIVNSATLIRRSISARRLQHSFWKWELALGILLMILAILFFWHPLLLGATFAVWTAIAFIILGIFRIVLTFRLRKNRLA
jgi:uncharacterized membrane protein HdeD (DUF308 family)